MGSLAVHVKVTAWQSVGLQKKMRKKKDKMIGAGRILGWGKNDFVVAGKEKKVCKADSRNFKINLIVT